MYGHCAKEFGSFLTDYISLSKDLVIPVLRVYLRNENMHENLNINVHSGFICNSFSLRKLVNGLTYCGTSIKELWLSNRKEHPTDVPNCIHESQSDLAEQKKPDFKEIYIHMIHLYKFKKM